MNMRNINSFFRGMIEFRLSFCTAYADLGQAEAYDKGRELAHRLTLRRFEV